eukprot:5766880-Prorocentrum_lima.AAC.1
MTSSLVGSEMCIRDRSECMRASRGRSKRTRPSKPAAPPLGGGDSLNQPVSYTHLTLPTICSV